jgi:hypothetical protein
LTESPPRGFSTISAAYRNYSNRILPRFDLEIWPCRSVHQLQCSLMKRAQEQNRAMTSDRIDRAIFIPAFLVKIGNCFAKLRCWTHKDSVRHIKWQFDTAEAARELRGPLSEHAQSATFDKICPEWFHAPECKRCSLLVSPMCQCTSPLSQLLQVERHSRIIRESSVVT